MLVCAGPGITGNPAATGLLVLTTQFLVALISLRHGTWPSAVVVVAVLFRVEIADILRRRRFVVEVPGFKARLDRGPGRSRRRP
jgi:hypothetical protein